MSFLSISISYIVYCQLDQGANFVLQKAQYDAAVHHFSGAPRGAFQQPVYNKCKVRWLRVLARPLQAVHNVFFV